jgi:hypothetical protein
VPPPAKGPQSCHRGVDGPGALLTAAGPFLSDLSDTRGGELGHNTDSAGNGIGIKGLVVMGSA